AGRVAAVAAILIAWAWGGTPNSVKRDVQQRFPRSAPSVSGDVTQPPPWPACGVTTITLRASVIGLSRVPAMTGTTGGVGVDGATIDEGTIEANGLRFGYLAAGGSGP